MTKRRMKSLSASSFLLAATLVFSQLQTSAQPVEILVNGGFESGNPAGWTALATGSPFGPWRVDKAGYGLGFGLVKTSPQEGSFVAWNGFAGFGPFAFVMFQDVTIPAGYSALLQWNDRVQWNFTVGNRATQPNTYQVLVEDPATVETLEVIHDFSTGTQDTNPTGDTGWVGHTVDLSAYAGQTIRLNFVEVIPQVLTGVGQAEIDGVSLLVEEIPQAPALLQVPLDIKPGSCPNPVNVSKRGVVPVAILGSAGLDVAEIDESTILLAGVAPVRIGWEDVGGLVSEGEDGEKIVLDDGDDEPSGCEDCTESEPDGLLDMVLKFDAQELLTGIVEALGDVPGDRECVIVTLTALTLEGVEVVGEDTILFINNEGRRRCKTYSNMK